jgi:hypothetical protein
MHGEEECLMHRRIPLAIFAALLAGVLAACGSSAGQPAAPAADQPAPTTIPAAPNAQPALAAPTISLPRTFVSAHDVV